MEPECGQQKERPCFSDRELDAAMNLRTAKGGVKQGAIGYGRSIRKQKSEECKPGDMETGEGDSGSYIMKSGKWNKLLGNGG